MLHCNEGIYEEKSGKHFQTPTGTGRTVPVDMTEILLTGIFSDNRITTLENGQQMQPYFEPRFIVFVNVHVTV